MARTSVAVQTIPFQKAATVTFTAADVTNGNMFDNDGSTVLLVKAGAGAVTVTVTAVEDEAGRAVNLTQNVSANAEAIIGPLRTGWWNQSGADIGKVHVSCSAAASIAALKLQR